MTPQEIWKKIVQFLALTYCFPYAIIFAAQNRGWNSTFNVPTKTEERVKIISDSNTPLNSNSYNILLKILRRF
jgi:hypothetical protein